MSDSPLPTGPVVILGGTGKTGRRVADRLSVLGIDARPVARSTTTPFDWEDPRTWERALSGAGAAYITYSPDLAFPGADQRVAAVARILATQGVSRVVLLSGRGEDGALASEEALLNAVPTATIVSCAFFTQNFTEGPFLSGVIDGQIAIPVSAEVREPFVDVDDVAEVVVAALTDDAHQGRKLELTGPRSVTFPEVTRLLRDDAGRDVSFREISLLEFVEHAVSDGLTAEVAHGFGDLLSVVLDGRISSTTTTVHAVLGRPATPIGETIRRAAAHGCLGQS